MPPPEQLGAFAARWLADPRPVTRDAPLDYRIRPLDGYYREPLVKRLFKLAETARDDAVMGDFLAALDRSVRRRRVTRHDYCRRQFGTRAEAKADRWRAEGRESAGVYGVSGRFHAHDRRPGERVVTPPNTAMPQPAERRRTREEQPTVWDGSRPRTD